MNLSRFLVLLAPLFTLACGALGRSQDIESFSTLEMASVVFHGHPSSSAIKRKLDVALSLYDAPISDDQYSHAVSALAALRRIHGTGEMEVLEHMIHSHVPSVRLTFPEAAALSSAFLAKGDD